MFRIPRYKSYIADFLFLSPTTYNEIIITANNFSNLSAIGCDGINPILIKNNITSFANQLMYIFNISFAKAVFPKLFKNAVFASDIKSGSITEPSNYRPISKLTFFFKLLEKFFYIRRTTFMNDKNILHPHQFGF